jgi:hypothetical protein
MLGTKEFQKVPFHGSSMDPIFKNADFVWIDFSKVENPTVGDVVVYQGAQKELVCHRIIGMVDNSFFVKGDNSLLGERVSPQAHWGRVMAFEKQGRLHHLKNHTLVSNYCSFQMYFQKTNSTLAHRLARKIGLLYLDLVKVLVAQP